MHDHEALRGLPEMIGDLKVGDDLDLRFSPSLLRPKNKSRAFAELEEHHRKRQRSKCASQREQQTARPPPLSSRVGHYHSAET